MAKFDKLHDNIMSAEGSLSLTPAGNGGYDMHPETLAPQKMGMKPQTPAQHAAVTKAGRTSAMKRKISAGKPLISTPKVGM